VDTQAFLRRLGLAGHDRPGVESLFRLHAAFVEAVPYETVQYRGEVQTSTRPAQVVGSRG
jgi:arylamine N-acetyltransferase